MIRVDRNRRDQDGNIIQPANTWTTEGQTLTTALNTAANANQFPLTFNEAHYQNRDTKRVLEKLFYGKCCYCEKPLIDFDFDVEHFRPKNTPKECLNATPAHHGYYWLVYRWDNMYAACKRCNRTFYDEDTADQKSHNRLSGKLNSFPLQNPTQRARTSNCNLQLEDPLLLDPCNDHPEDHITFTATGVPIPKNMSLKGQETIRIIGLDEIRPSNIREKNIKKAIDHLKNAFRFDVAGNSAGRDYAINNYLEMTQKDAPYSAASRAVIKDPCAFALNLEYQTNPTFFQNIEQRLP